MEIITTHINADFDCLGSMVAALKLYPEAYLLFSGSQEKNLRRYIKEQALKLPLKKAKLINWEDVSTIIFVDTRNLERIGRIAEYIKNFQGEIHIYDHHPESDNDIHGNFELIEEVGATVTLFTEIIKERKIKLLPEESTVMALAIYEDTGSFTFPSTTPRDMQAGSYLLGMGADLSIISEYSKKEMLPHHIKLLNDLIEGMETFYINGHDVTIITASTLEYVSDLAVLAHKLDDMFNLSIFFLLVRMGNRMSLVARSNVSYVDVSKIAKSFGGGGHPSAASASIKDLTLTEAKNKLLKLFNSKLPHPRRAEDIMSTPVWTVNADDSIEEAGKLMNQYSINNLPIEENDKLIGIISRQIIDKAIFHGLSKHSVKEYMSPDIYPVIASSPAINAQKHLLEHNVRFVPVVIEHKVVGVITRTDILRAIYDDNLALSDKYMTTLNGKLMKNISSILRERVSEDIFSLLLLCGKIADKLSINVYVVGGFVRDLFLNTVNLDVDLVVEGNAIDFTRHLTSAVQGSQKIHKQFGTAVIVCPDGFKIDVATARTEFYQHPAALPTIQTSSIKQDLFRRDFTCNALAIQINKEKFGTLLDFFGGQKDIKEKIIRVLHGLSFVEDPTRVFRAIRFEDRFGFSIGKQTLNFIQTAVAHSLFNKLSGKRLLTELVMLLKETTPDKSILRMGELDVLKFIHPKIDVNITSSLFQSIREILLWYSYMYLEPTFEKWMVYFVGLVNNLEPKELDALIARLVIPRKLRELILSTRNAVNNVLPRIERNPKMLPSKVYHELSLFSLETVLFLMAKTESRKTKKLISSYLTNYQWKKSFITGKDLIKMGIPKGPLYHEIIQHILDLQLDGIISTYEEALLWVEEKYRNSIKYR